VDRNEGVWVGTRGAGVFQLRNGRFYQVISNGMMRAEVQAIHQDRAGRLWFGTEAGLFLWDEREWKSYRTSEGLSSDVVTALADDDQGNLWIGTRRGGLNRFRDGRFTAFRKSDGLPSDDLSSLLVDKQGALWIGTFGGGLARFQNGKFARFTSRDGLISNSLGYLVEEEENLWIGSNRGVLRFSKERLNDFADGKMASLAGRAYGTADGLPTVECSAGSQPGVWRGHDGRLWLPTIKGLAFVNPAELRPNTNPPPVTIELALIDDVPAKAKTRDGDSSGKALILRPGEERLEIQYSSLNLGAPERARFKYRLEGYEKNWTEVGGDTRAAHYSKLTPWFVPGHYDFHVIACNEDGLWNEVGSTLAILVQPPFWRTWWFLTATALGVFGLIAGIVHYLSTQKLQRQVALLKQQEALERERARIARDIHDQVGASLTQVALLGELVETDKELPEEVSAHAQQISQTARETTRSLDEIVWTVNPSNDTLEGLINYICKHAQEYLAVAGCAIGSKFRSRCPPFRFRPRCGTTFFSRPRKQSRTSFDTPRPRPLGFVCNCSRTRSFWRLKTTGAASPIPTRQAFATVFATCASEWKTSAASSRSFEARKAAHWCD
jgi:hypothetical protein